VSAETAGKHWQSTRKAAELGSAALSRKLSGWQGTEGYQYGAILRDISVRKREA
jgi:hypothetical protein